MKPNAFLMFGALFFLLLSLNACKKDKDTDPIEETHLPKVAIQLPDGKKTFWNTVSVEVEASSIAEEIKSVEFVVNGQLIDVKENPPFIFEWDTRDFADGEVELKAIATDTKDQTKETTRTVSVLNTLLSLQIPKGHLIESNNHKYFVFITSAQREVMYFSQIQEEPFTGKVERPEGFEDATFDLHFVKANPISALITTYSKFPAGSFSPKVQEGRGASVSESELAFYDIPNHDYFSLSNHYGAELQGNDSYKVKSYENLDFAYLYLRIGVNGIYQIIDNLSASPVHEISLNSTPFQMDEHQFSHSSPLSSYYYSVKGHTGTAAESAYMEMFSGYSNSEVNNVSYAFHTPSNETRFKHFSSYITAREGNTVYSNHHYFDISGSLTKRSLNANVASYQMVGISNSVSGDAFDVISSHYRIWSMGKKFDWMCYSGDTAIEFPPIPTQLTEAFNYLSNSNLVFKDANIVITTEDYDHLQSYDDFLEAVSGRAGNTFLAGATKMISVGRQFNY